MSSPPTHGLRNTILCEVLEIQAEKLLSYSWTDAAFPGKLDWTGTWTLESDGSGTRLFVEHRGLAADDPTSRSATS
jgi:uncharacterized protein YndB with AHSA1/START domain